MQKNKWLVLIIIILFASIIGEAVYYNSKLKKEKKENQNFKEKTNTALHEDFSKGLKNVSVLVKIKKQTSEGEYNDSLFYTLEQWEEKTADDIKAEEQKRVDNWLNMVKKP